MADWDWWKQFLAGAGSALNPLGFLTGQAGIGIKGELDKPGQLREGENYPGAELDVSKSEQDRAAMAPVLAGMEQQAQTGGGAWEDALRRGTLAAQNAAMAVGQSTPGVGYQTALRNIGNAQAAAKQRGAGQSNILRAQQQQQSMGDLGSALGQQGAQDIQQATESAAARQQKLQAANALAQQNLKTGTNIVGGLSQVIPFLSKGGPVPGEPEVFGDDSRNDTVPAMLSPKEIVLPLHVTQAPDAPERAADFVRAVQNKEHPSHKFDDGGTVPGDPTAGQAPDASLGSNPISATLSKFGLGASQQPLSEKYGSLLQTKPYEQTREMALANQQRLAQAAAGKGPSVAPQELQNATDANIAAMMQAASQARGAAPMQSGALTSALGAAESGAAGQGAATVAGEQQRAQQAAIQQMARQREQDMALARAQQQAAWKNTMMNMGLGMEQQQMLMNMLSGAGQAAAAGSSAMGGQSRAPQMAAPNADALAQPMGSSPSEWQNPYGGYAGGGEVMEDEARRSKAFLDALGRSA